MFQLKDFGLVLLIVGVPVLLAASLLFLRDKMTLRHGISQQERNRLIKSHSSRTVDWWHGLTVFFACVSLPLNLANFAHQQARSRVFEAILALLVIFFYYRKRSEERIADPPPHDSRPIH